MNILFKIATESGSRYLQKRLELVNKNTVPSSSIQQGNARHLINKRKEIVENSKIMGNLGNTIHNVNSKNLNSVKGEGAFRITGR